MFRADRRAFELDAIHRNGLRTVLALAPLRAARPTLDPVTGVVQVMARFRLAAARGHALPIWPDFRVEAKNEWREAGLDNRLYRHRRSQHNSIGSVVTSPCGMVHPVAPDLQVSKFPACLLVVENAELSGAQ